MNLCLVWRDVTVESFSGLARATLDLGEANQQAWERRARTAEANEAAWQRRAVAAEANQQDAERRAHAAEAGFEALRSSRSWRLTAPARRLAARLRRT